MENKLTYSDFKIGQTLTCIKLGAGYYGGDSDNERLILGERYVIEDLDWHFPNRVCIKLKGPFYFHSEFVPIECFCDISDLRDKKLKQLGI
jgi:hypothetical protein